MNTMTDSEVLARLIYLAYIAPDPHAPLKTEALLPFQAALELYARTAQNDWRAATSQAALEQLAGKLTLSASDSDTEQDCSDSCPVEWPEAPAEETPPLREKNLDNFQPVSVKLKASDTHSRDH